MSGYSGSLRQLGSVQKPAKGPAYTRFVNRPLGRRVAAAAHQTRLTPNQISLISFALTLSGLSVAVLVPPVPVSAVATSILLAAGYVLDSADGQLARLRGVSSPVGEWLDHILDCAKASLVHLAVLVLAFLRYDIVAAWYLVPMAFLVIANVIFFGGILTEQLRRARRGGDTGTGPALAPGSALKSWLMLPVDYGVLAWSFSVIFIPGLFLAAYTVLAVAGGLFLVVYLGTWYRELVDHPGEAP